MPSYRVKALENTQSILCGLFLVCEHFCSGRTASHRTALDFRGIFVLLDAGGLSPAKEKRAKSTEKTGCPTCVLLLIDAFPFVYKTSRLRWRRDVAFLFAFGACEIDAAEIFLGDLEYHGAEREERDEVRDRHETVERVGDVPDKVERGDAADDDHDNENELVDLRGAETQQVLHAA